jgi:amino acid adenylation domain-containing protein
MPAEDHRALLQDALLKIRALRSEVAALRRGRNEPIAIVGAGCRLPGGVRTPDDYWTLLRDGVDATGDIPQGRWDVDAFYDPDPDAPGKMYIRRGAFLDEVEKFDADFFGIAPREALRLDPQQRLLLEVSWEALENAALAPDRLSGSATGVFIGVMGADYSYRQAHGLRAEEIDPYMLAGSELSFAAGRLAYQLGLQGPTMSVATACSSSLVSLHLASQALRAGECDLALAGGVNLVLDPVTCIMLSRLRALARDGRCKTFDAAADGYARGEGCGILVLERLSDAVEKQHRILAVVRGSAVNHDGPSAGLTVPNGPAQERLLRKAFEAAGVEPAQLGYVEAHGTGTALGDPIEVRALARVMEHRKQPLPIGSVKTAIGHLEAAAGVASVLKVALALRHRAIPPSLHFRTPNPHIPWSELPVRVADRLCDWPATSAPLLAGVSSFGLGGVNAHVVLEEPPAVSPEADAAASGPCLLTLSARTDTALAELAHRYDGWLGGHPELSWRDVCFTANHGRAQFERRRYIVASSISEAREQLQNAAAAAAPTPEHQRLAAMGEAWLRGGALDLPALGPGRRLELPTYPFERQRYWVLDAEGLLSSGGTRPAKTERTEQLPLLEAFCRKAGEVLGLSTPPEAGRCLLDLGLDSLMAAELQSWLQTEFTIAAELRQVLAEISIAGLIGSLRVTGGRAEAERAEPAVEARTLPVSEGQKALWFIHESDPTSAAYNVGVALRIRAAVDAGPLRLAFQALTDRHASLRATFAAPEGEPVQHIRPAVPVFFKQIAVETDAEAALVARVGETHRQPFDLRAGPLLRVHLFSRGAADHVLLLSMHHIVCDALSIWTMLQEVQALYAGQALSAPVVSYADYIGWQQEMLAGPEGERLWEFWRARLGGELPSLALPTDKPRPVVLGFSGASHVVHVSGDLTAKLRNLARGRQATLHNVLLAAYGTLLRRYTGQEDLIVGCATAGRPGQFAGVVGYFTNPVPIRADLSGNPEFVELLEQIRRVTLDALDHQQMPFGLLVQRLQPPRDLSRSPIFQGDFALLKRPPAYRHGRREGLPFEPFELAAEEGQFDLSLHVTEDDADLTAAFKYSTALFEPATIRAMAECFVRVLANLADDPRQRIDKVPLFGDERRTALLEAGHGAHVSYEPLTVQQMFERRVETAPDAIAAEEFDTSATQTYAELNRRSNRLAHHLGDMGAKRDVLIGICLERSLDLVASILAVLKAGAAYVPLDPSYPPERLAFMMEDAAIPVLLTTGRLAAGLRVPEGVAVVDLERDWPVIEANPDDNLPAQSGLENLAYVIYTSGSTGRPKGTLITHGGLTNYLCWCLDAYRVAEGCGAPVSSAIGFDATITSFFAPLAVGGKVVLLPERDTLEALAECLRRDRGFSLIKITPAHLEALSHLLAPEDCEGRANVFVIGGEALRGDMLAFWQRHAPATQLINEYGPTETVVGCCIYEAREPASPSVPIGKPIANTQLYILDASMQPVPRGVIGELYIGGAGVARGYLNRPDLTAAKFVPDPFSSEPGARLFRTGDLVRVLPDGNLDFLGRADQQVKIRGYRIELGEIESLLAQHPQIAAAVAVVHQGHIVAYVVPRDAGPGAAELRRYLAERLPDHMVPSFLLALPEFPLTPNGKVDRKALPAPETARAGSQFVPPRDSVELKIAGLWEEVLGIRPVGVKDNFFDLGGHSLLAVRLVTRLQREFSKAVPLAAILRGPTVERLADLVRNAAPGPRSTLVPIHASGSRPPLYCVPGAGGNVIYLYHLARHLGPDQPFYGLQGVGFDGEAAPQTSVEEMAARYLLEIESAQPRGPYFLGGHSLGGWVAYEMAQQLLRKGREVPLVAIIDTAAPVLGPARDTSSWDNARWIAELASRIGQLLNPDLNVSAEALRELDADAQFDRFKEALRGADLFPGDASSDHLRNVLELFKAHSQVRYRLPRDPLPVRVALLRTETPPPGLPFAAPSWGWESVAETEVHIVPGEHLTALRSPHVLVLADRLTACLDQAQRAHAERGGKAAACPPR